MITINGRIEGGDFGSAGAATRALKERLRMAGVPADTMRRAMIASYEAEMNVVIHARRGMLWARLDGHRLDLEVVDEGPGIPDLELALREGWSTASAEARRMGFGAGMGLPNIRRSSDRFEIDSRVGHGTRVRSTILVDGRPDPAPPAGAGTVPSLRADRCRACHACLGACPTAALRVRGGGPVLLAGRCVGCTECARACRDRVFDVAGADTVRDAAGDGAALVVTAGFLAAFAAPPADVLAALAVLGFRNVSPLEDWDLALRRDALALARDGAGPLVATSCPAVTGLVAARFPGLLGRLAPFAAPVAAAATGFPLERLAIVPACPAQGEAASAERRAGRVAVVAPGDLVAAVRPLLAGARPARAAPAEGKPGGPTDGAGAEEVAEGVLRVTGMRHALRALELAEAGALPEVALLEAFACDGGCLGSPYLGLDPFVAAHRLAVAGSRARPRAFALAARGVVAPRQGARLDADMANAIRMLGAIDEAAHALPGRDCGACGAPTCAAFAEDLVVGRAGAADCAHRTRPLAGAAPRRSAP